MHEARDLVVVEPGAGRKVMLSPGFGVDFKLWSEDTGGAISIVEHPFAPGALVPPHMHAREDEFSIVTMGEIGFRSGDREVTLAAGGYIAKPRRELHAMWNAGPAPARMIEVISPGGFEGYFAELAGLLAAAGDEQGTEPDVQVIRETAARYGLSFDFGWVPELVERYGLNPPV